MWVWLYVWVCVYVYIYICVHYYRLVIKYHQLTLQGNNYIDLRLHSRQENKQANKKVFTLVGDGT